MIFRISPSRNSIAGAAALVVAIAVAGCGGAARSEPPTPVPTVAAQNVGLQMEIASSELAVGRNRFTFGLIDNNHPLKSGRPRLTFFSIHGNRATAVETTTATFNGFSGDLPNTPENRAAIQLGGVFVAYPTFSHAGSWGVEARLNLNGRTQNVRLGFTVAPHSSSPAVGSPAPRSNNPTVAQEPAWKLDSGRPPDDMHRLSIAQAIAQHKPLLVLFSTPAFCESRLCGPETEIVKTIERRYRQQVNFIHIEIYKDANPLKGRAATVLQWHLFTEPWVFVINRRGIITAKFEGPTTAGEIDPALQAAIHS